MEAVAWSVPLGAAAGPGDSGFPRRARADASTGRWSAAPDEPAGAFFRYRKSGSVCEGTAGPRLTRADEESVHALGARACHAATAWAGNRAGRKGWLCGASDRF